MLVVTTVTVTTITIDLPGIYFSIFSGIDCFGSGSTILLFLRRIEHRCRIVDSRCFRLAVVSSPTVALLPPRAEKFRSPKADRDPKCIPTS